MIPDDRILLASNAPKFPPADLVGVCNYRPCVSDASLEKVTNSNRSEPLCIFTTLELTAKYLGYQEKKEIQNFSKQVIENAKSFLYGRRKEHAPDCDEKVTNKAKKKLPDWFPVVLVCQLFVCALVFSTDRLLKFLGILDHHDNYFYFIFLAIATLVLNFVLYY